MTRHHRLIALILAGLLAVPLAWAGTLYKWKDKDGTVHFGETPPPGVEAVPLNVNLEPDPVQDPYPDPPVDEAQPGSAEQQRNARAEARAQARQERERIEEQCQTQRGILEQLEPRPNVLIQNPDGTTTRMDDQERLRLIDEAKAFIRDNCS